MATYNRAILMGNIVRDPKIRHTPKGTAVCEFAIALNRKWKDGDGEDQEDVSFVDCVAWARRGEVIEEYLGKGDPIHIEARVQQDRWTDKETGKGRSKIVFVVDNFTFVGGKSDRTESRRDESEAPAGADEGMEVPF